MPGKQGQSEAGMAEEISLLCLLALLLLTKPGQVTPFAHVGTASMVSVLCGKEPFDGDLLSYAVAARSFLGDSTMVKPRIRSERPDLRYDESRLRHNDHV